MSETLRPSPAHRAEAWCRCPAYPVAHPYDPKRKVHEGAPCPSERVPILTSRPDLVLEGFEPRRLVSANRRIHHMVRAEVCAYWRRLGHDLVVGEYGHADVGETWHHALRLTMTFRFPDLRRRDCHNLYGYVIKPLVDGMVDARLIPDDDDRHLIGPDVRRDPERGPHRIRIDVEDVA